MTNIIQYHVLLHLAAFISVAALALRDQLKLRIVLLLGTAIAVINYYDAPSAPDWEDLFWNVVGFAINLVVVVQIALDRTPLGMSAEERTLYETFEILTPGEFRTLVRPASWHTAGADHELTQEGAKPDALFYVLSGDIVIEKSGRLTAYGPKTFIGEIAFLHRCPASATVRLAEGSRYIAWPLAALDRQIAGRNGLDHAITRLISFDMALKVVRA